MLQGFSIASAFLNYAPCIIGNIPNGVAITAAGIEFSPTGIPPVCSLTRVGALMQHQYLQLAGMPCNASMHNCWMPNLLSKHEQVTSGAGEIDTHEPPCILKAPRKGLLLEIR